MRLFQGRLAQACVYPGIGRPEHAPRAGEPPQRTPAASEPPAPFLSDPFPGAGGPEHASISEPVDRRHASISESVDPEHASIPEPVDPNQRLVNQTNLARRTRPRRPSCVHHLLIPSRRPPSPWPKHASILRLRNDRPATRTSARACVYPGRSVSPTWTQACVYSGGGWPKHASIGRPEHASIPGSVTHASISGSAGPSMRLSRDRSA